MGKFSIWKQKLQGFEAQALAASLMILFIKFLGFRDMLSKVYIILPLVVLWKIRD